MFKLKRISTFEILMFEILILIANIKINAKNIKILNVKNVLIWTSVIVIGFFFDFRNFWNYEQRICYLSNCEILKIFDNIDDVWNCEWIENIV